MISDSVVIEVTKCLLVDENDKVALPDIPNRKALMGFLSLILANKVNPNRLKLFSDFDWTNKITSPEDLKQNLDDSVSPTIFEDLKQVSETKWNELVTRLDNVNRLAPLKKLSEIEALSIYERVLHRLQETALKSPLQGAFPYQYWGEVFKDVIDALLPPERPKSIYFPNSHRGEFPSYVSALFPSAAVYSESDEQSSCYINHKLLIVGAKDTYVFENSSLEKDSPLVAKTMDLAITACIASSQSPSSSSLHRTELKGFFDPSRVDLESLGSNPSKEFALISQILWALKEGGTGIVFIGKGPLQREKEASSRRSLLESGVVDSVIKLSDKLLGGRSTSVYALLIRKNIKSETVLFLDATSMFDVGTKHSYLSDKKSLSEAIVTNNNGTRVDIEKVMQGDAELFPEFYLSKATDIKEVEIERLKKDLVEAQINTDKSFSLLRSLKK